MPLNIIGVPEAWVQYWIQYSSRKMLCWALPKLLIEDLDHVRHRVGDWQGLRGTRLFVTGGTGFVGKWLLETLVWVSDELNLDLSATVLTRDPEGFRKATPHLGEHAAVRLLKGAVQEFQLPEGEFPFVIHAATERPTEPAAAFRRDVEGTERVLEFARTHGTRRFLFTSSGAVYGKQPPEMTHIPESYAGAPLTTDYGSAYGQAKRASEFLCFTQARDSGFEVVVARLFAFVGPHLPLNENFAAGNFIRDVIGGGPIRITGDGTPRRSYLYAADLAVWLWTILMRGQAGTCYNVGSDQVVTIAELARIVARIGGRGTSVEIAGRPVSGAAPQQYVPSVARARTELGLCPEISLEEGLRRTFAWLG